MSKGRLEAFSDGVIAIIITIMVLELKVPHETDWAALQPVLPALLTYVLSFVYLGIYWNNHHHMLHATDHVTGGIMWANLHLLFWLSLTPFVTGWMGENHFVAVPTAAYGIVQLMAAVAYTILAQVIIASQGAHSKLKAAIGKDKKGLISLAMYASAIPLAFVNERISVALYIAVALMWLIPDRRIERRL
jgi:TMEM175 potassium channel family protein